jgi:hypothetical protein
VLHTDLSEANARDTILTFERLLDAYRQLGWETRGELPVKLHIVVFDDPSEFDTFAGETVGFHVRVTPFEPLVVMPNAGRIDNWSTLKHELTHYIAMQSMPFQPAWFAEGIAGYFQSARFDSNQRFMVGEVPLNLHRVLRHTGLESMRELLNAESSNFELSNVRSRRMATSSVSTGPTAAIGVTPTRRGARSAAEGCLSLCSGRGSEARLRDSLAQRGDVPRAICSSVTARPQLSGFSVFVMRVARVKATRA